MFAKKLAASTAFPKITINGLDGNDMTLAAPSGNTNWQMVVIYRGKHCPLCSRYLKQLETMRDKFQALGVDVVAVSGDTEEKARTHMKELGVTYPVGFGLTIEQMKQLGLYISHPRSAAETDRPFAEPGLFVINTDGDLQVTDISNGPFARPDLETLLNGLKFIRDPSNDYPIRGTYE